MGEILGDVLFMYAPVDSGHKWIADADGEVVENINPTKDGHSIIYEIIEGINAHFGTSFTEQDDMDKAYTIGQYIPNWSVYGKIEMEQIKVAIKTGNDYTNIFGKIKGSICIVSINSSNYCNICTNEGVIQFPQGGPQFDDNIKNMVKYKLSAYNVDNVTTIVEEYQQNDILANWDEYTIIN